MGQVLIRKKRSLQIFKTYSTFTLKFDFLRELWMNGWGELVVHGEVVENHSSNIFFLLNYVESWEFFNVKNNAIKCIISCFHWLSNSYFISKIFLFAYKYVTAQYFHKSFQSQGQTREINFFEFMNSGKSVLVKKNLSSKWK